MKKILFVVLVVFQSCTIFNYESGELILSKPNAQLGFEFPYYLFIPDGCSSTSEITLVVEPNNSGFVTDDFDEHIGSAERVAGKEFYIGNYIARKLKCPLLVPVFPRAESTWKIYTHALDRDVMTQKGSKLKRIDNQLIAMVDDARTKLKKSGYNTADKFFMTGFSASGTFVNRFTLIHPDKVLAAAAGGLNGLLILPIKKLEGVELNYPIGTHDFQNIFNKPFDSTSFKQTPQFLFMGELDDNDAVPYDDAFDEQERNLIYDLLGKEMMPMRWNNCSDIYEEENVDALIKVYPNVGHNHPVNIHEEILDFFNTITEKSLKA